MPMPLIVFFDTEPYRAAHGEPAGVGVWRFTIGEQELIAGPVPFDVAVEIAAEEGRRTNTPRAVLLP